MAKKVLTILKLELEAGKASPAPPIGPAMGQHGVNIMAFVKEYNERTSSQQGNIIPVELSVYEDRSFSFITKTSPATALLKKAAGISKGSSEPNRDKVGTVTENDLRSIAEIKMQDLNANTIEQAAEMIRGTCVSMGIEVKG